MSDLSTFNQTGQLRYKPALYPVTPPMAKLTVVNGTQKGEVIFVRGKLQVFGRIAGIRLRDALASRSHMQIYYDGRNFILEDLKSCNGTYLNGIPIHRSANLHHGDHIRAGGTTFLIEIHNPDPQNDRNLVN